MVRKKKSVKKKNRTFRYFKIIFLLLLLPVSVGAAIGGFYAFSRSVPSISELKSDVLPPSTKIYSNDGVLIGELKIAKGTYARLKSIPKDLINAVIAVEDENFWEHKGIDYTAIIRAALKDLLKMHLKEGGSTITQQLAKINFLTSEKTFTRKLKEFVMAHRIEKNLSKEEILELYLNKAYFGHGAYGTEMASKVYFGKPVANISLPEAALLAGLLKAPYSYSPFRDFQKAKDRQAVVLSRMEEAGFLSRKQKEDALRRPVYLAEFFKGSDPNQYFIDFAKRYLEGKYGEESVYSSGLTVHTTLDRRAQAEAQRALRQGLRDLDKRRGWRGPVERGKPVEEDTSKAKPAFWSIAPAIGDIIRAQVIRVARNEATVSMTGMTGKLSVYDAIWASKQYDVKTKKSRYMEDFDLSKILKPGDTVAVMVKSVEKGAINVSLEQEPEVQGAVVAIEPHSGFIKALVGGYDFKKSEFNRAVFARRQAGSAFKPIVYSVALNNGFTPASVVTDEEIGFNNGKGGKWIPQNYEGDYRGSTRVREALAYSRNIVTIKLVDEMGIDRLINFASRLGIQKSNIPRDLTVALGSLSISPLEMTSMYNMFSNGGLMMEPLAIKYVTDKSGRVLESNEPRPERILDEQTAYLVTSMLKDVIGYGTGWRARALKAPAAGKTGTTNDYKDAWFMGFTTGLTCGVWVGYDDVRSLGTEETGSRAATPIWTDFMLSMLSQYDAAEFPMPHGIITRMIDPDTGLLASRWTEGPILEYFKEGTEPSKYAESIWDKKEHEKSVF